MPPGLNKPAGSYEKNEGDGEIRKDNICFSFRIRVWKLELACGKCEK